MKHVAAYLLLVLGGNASPSASDIESVLSAVGIESDADKLKTLIKELKGKNLEELIAAGASKLSAIPTAGSAPAAAAPAAAAPAAAGPAAAEKKEEKPKKEEKKEEEEDDDMGFGLFD
ncbi:ribosomal protein 60S [Gonapodya prolifera JEL478]|uniref:Ribosomal protein 60S n=1 Tax=Gonapodya prolifera (strain JEL478) TaxID=1344416 RepID=A0A139AUK3_GONPJ|nr:ribosomal protein 60S [Gonapodya prolifera JEL478]|eukprot:KXS20420.1 ribosomal protein 60S [Gonapodya prolifera JEL478]